jgi:hypothetical protein
MTNTPTLCRDDFELLHAQIQDLLHKYESQLHNPKNDRATALAIYRIFVMLFGSERSRREAQDFCLYVAPMMRQLTIARIRSVNVGQTSRMGVGDLEQWLSRLEGFDSRCVQMIDLHYFVGLSPRSTADALGVSTELVIRDLRFAKAWLMARTRWLPKPPPE